MVAVALAEELTQWVNAGGERVRLMVFEDAGHVLVMEWKSAEKIGTMSRSLLEGRARCR